LAMDLINQRFDRGFMVYIAGEKTLRFRLNMSIAEKTINSLFERLFIALADMRDGRPYQDLVVRPLDFRDKGHISNIVFTTLTKDNFKDYAQDIEALEKSAYEKGRRDTIERLESWIKEEDSLGLILTCDLDGQRLFAGFAIGGPIVHAQVDGPNQDPMRKKHNTFYSADIAINAKVRGMKLGHLLKLEQIRRVAGLRKSDGSPRYLYVSGRNRMGAASAMTHINEALGAYAVKIYEHQYGDPNAQALYYRLPIVKQHHVENAIINAPLIDGQNSINRSFTNAAPSFIEAFKEDCYRTLACQKLTLSNWATPNMIRYSELLRALMPAGQKHAYFTSGRDEVVDKGLRSLRFHRPQAEIAIGFSHQWLGNISAAARSLSHDEGQKQPFGFFNWPKVMHPAVVGPEQSLSELKTLLKSHAPESILGIVIELMGEKTAYTFDERFLHELDNIRKATNIPLVFVENASSYGRSGRSLFLTNALLVKPNMIWWFCGGQLGHVMVDDQYFVEKPLTLISTWDGDDMSMARTYEHLLAMSDARALKPIKDFEAAMKGISTSGLGCWHGIKLKDKETLDTYKSKAKELGVLFGSGFDHTLMVCPKPDASTEQFGRVKQVLIELL
ncbi:MAG TPA: hypothetical protein VEK06_01605, partial [Myxococcota bacterium]|nr:hypothetical protein [Myxococcota bacterium]